MMITPFIAIISFAITLIIVVGLHELGHALVAHYFSIEIKRISIGFGKALWSYRSKSGCEWIWARWPLGGYVDLLNTRIHPIDKSQWPHAFDKRPVWQRLVVLFAGSLFNLFTAWVCYTGFYLLGHHYPIAVIQEIAPNSLAAQARFQAQDHIISMNQHPVHSWEEAGIKLLMLIGTEHVQFTVKRQDGAIEVRDMNLSHLNFPPHTRSLWSLLGIKPSMKSISWFPPQTVAEAMLSGLNSITQLFSLLFTILQQLCLGYLPFSLLAGPLSLFALNLSAFLHGFTAFIHYIATFSLAIGIMNLFPLPGLDGGSIFYTCIEKVRGRPIPIAYEILFYRLTMIAFAVFLIQLILNDLTRLVR